MTAGVRLAALNAAAASAGLDPFCVGENTKPMPPTANARSAETIFPRKCILDNAGESQGVHSGPRTYISPGCNNAAHWSKSMAAVHADMYQVLSNFNRQCERMTQHLGITDPRRDVRLHEGNFCLVHMTERGHWRSHVDVFFSSERAGLSSKSYNCTSRAVLKRRIARCSYDPIHNPWLSIANHTS
jgi:hypothetical protein